MKNFFFNIVKFMLIGLSRLPFGILYFLSDLVFIVGYYIVG